MKLEIRDVGFSYEKGKDILRGINLTLEEPGLVCIIGPNGVGKSTLVKCIDKILEPTSGEILMDQRDLRGMSFKELSKIVGYVPVSSGDYFPMTVLETVMMGRHPSHRLMSSADDDFDAVYDILKSMRIEHLAMRNFGDLSAGQHQRVAIARGLAQEPRLLILDEPTANLDARYQIMVTRMLLEMSHEKGITVLMISHDLNIASRFADEVMLMTYPGIIYRTGSPEEVITVENIRYAYGMDCRMTEVNGRPHVILLDEMPEEALGARGGDYPDYRRVHCRSRIRHLFGGKAVRFARRITSN